MHLLLKHDDDSDLKKKLKNSFFRLDTSTFSLIVPQVNSVRAERKEKLVINVAGMFSLPPL